MRAQKTKGDISTAIVRKLKKLWNIGGIYGHHYKDNTLRIALKAQDQIEWDHFMLGRISKQWSVLKKQHYRDIESRRTGERWTSNLLKEIWNTHWTMWNHRNEALHTTGNHPVLGSRRFDKKIFRGVKKGAVPLHSTERYLFAVTMDDVKEWTAHRKQKWLRTVSSAARYSSSVRHQSTQQSRLFMYNWLQGSWYILHFIHTTYLYSKLHITSLVVLSRCKFLHQVLQATLPKSRKAHKIAPCNLYVIYWVIYLVMH